MQWLTLFLTVTDQASVMSAFTDETGEKWVASKWLVPELTQSNPFVSL